MKHMPLEQYGITDVAGNRKENSLARGGLISFRKDYYTNRFPLEASYYQCDEACIHATCIIHSALELREFQAGLSGGERAGEQIFIAYYTHVL